MDNQRNTPIYIVWVNTNPEFKDPLFHYTFVPDIKVNLNDVSKDMFPNQILDALFCIKNDKEKTNYNILKTLILDKGIDIIVPNDTSGKHPFLKYTSFIEPLPNGKQYIDDLEKVIVYPVDSSDNSITYNKEIFDKYLNICLEINKNK